VSTFSRNPDFIHADMGGETVMMGIEQGDYFGFNPVASRIWDLLETPKSMAELSELLQAEYDVAAPQCQQDLQTFLAELIQLQIVRPCPTA
jgi:hypothetical protein